MLTYDKVISVIEEGKTFPNFVKLCEALEETPERGGNSRKAQIKQFEYYFKWETVGQRIIITEVLPKPIIEYHSSKSPYGRLMTIIFLQLLVEYNNYYPDAIFYSSLTNLAKLLGFFNEDFVFFYDKHGKLTYEAENDLFLSERNSIPTKKRKEIFAVRENNSKAIVKKDLSVTDDFYNRVYRSYSPLITEMIEKLRRNGIVYPMSAYYAKFTTISNDTLELKEEADEFGDVKQSYNPQVKHTVRVLTDAEMSEYARISAEIMKKYSCSSISELFLKKRYYSYKKELKTESLKTLGFSDVYYLYRFIYNKELVEAQRDKLIDNIKEFNGIFKDRIRTSKLKEKTYLTNDEKIFNYLCERLIDKKANDVDIRDFVLETEIEKYFSSSYKISKVNEKHNSSDKVNAQNFFSVVNSLDEEDLANCAGRLFPEKEENLYKNFTEALSAGAIDGEYLSPKNVQPVEDEDDFIF